MCGRQLYLMTFGYGEAICPNCYNGEQPFIFLDKSYWLNRIVARFLEHEAPIPEEDITELLLDQASIEHETEILS